MEEVSTYLTPLLQAILGNFHYIRKSEIDFGAVQQMAKKDDKYANIQVYNCF